MNPGKSELWSSRLKIQALYPLIHLPGSEKFHNTTILRYGYGLLYMEHFIITCSFWFKKKKRLSINHAPTIPTVTCSLLLLNYCSIHGDITWGMKDSICFSSLVLFSRQTQISSIKNAHKSALPRNSCSNRNEKNNDSHLKCPLLTGPLL